MWKTSAVAAMCCGCVLAGMSTASADDRASFLALQHFDRLQSYRMHVTTRQGTKTVIQDITFVPPDRQADYIPQMHQTDVTIGRQTWIRGDDGTWTKLPQSFRAPHLDLRSRAYLEHLIGEATVTKISDGDLSGVKVAAYRFDFAAGHGHHASTSILWLGIHDGLPRRLTTTEGNATMSGVFSGFGERLTVPNPPQGR